jgi:aryl-alcohol dehydrogenase-like predicted oxidoreductase
LARFSSPGLVLLSRVRRSFDNTRFRVSSAREINEAATCRLDSDASRVSDTESIATIQEATDRGVTLLNTGDFYGMGHNVLLIRRAIERRRDRVFIPA